MEIIEMLQREANRIRLRAMTMTNHSGLGHTGGDLSSADILATLYLGGILNVDPERPAYASAIASSYPRDTARVRFIRLWLREGSFRRRC